MKSITIEVPEDKPGQGFIFKWEDGFKILTKLEDGEILIIANKEGLLSLANHFINLAQDGFLSGTHFHLDEFNSLEEGSCELIVEKG